MTPSRAATFAATLVLLDHAHTTGDYFVQRDGDAQAKGLPGSVGRAACARHVASHTATLGAALLVANRGLGLRLRPRRVAAGLVVSAVTHYAADRSARHWADEEPTTMLVRLAHGLGKEAWVQNDPTAGPLLDQAWHRACHVAAAAIIAG